MTWGRRTEVLPQSGPWAELDAGRAFGPSVLEDDDGALRMWYSGHDGSTGRILAAIQEPGGAWQRQGVAVDAGAAGETDAYGVESPCVVRTPQGYLMSYAGSDGADTRLHMASSRDGRRWQALGTFMQRGEPDAVGATHPCIVRTGQQWWLFYAGYDGADHGRRAAILAAVSACGASWDRLGPVLGPGPGEVAVSEPWVLLAQRRFYLFYVSDDGRRTTIDLASSDDAMSWDRRGVTLTGRDADVSRVRSPSAVKLLDGTLRLWFAEPDPTDAERSDRLWMTDSLDGSL